MGKNHRRKRQHKKKEDPYPEGTYIRRGVSHTRKQTKEERELKKYGRIRDI